MGSEAASSDGGADDLLYAHPHTHEDIPGDGDMFAALRARSASARVDEQTRRYLVVLGGIESTIAATLGAAAGASPHAPPAAYFACMLTALERGGAAHLKEIMYLLSVVLRHLSPSVIRAKYEAVSELLSRVCESVCERPAEDADVDMDEDAAAPASRRALPTGPADATTLRCALQCIGSVLAAVEASSDAWAHTHVRRLMAMLTAAATAQRSRSAVRTTSGAALVRVAAVHHAARSDVVSGILGDALARVCASVRAQDVNRFMQLVPLLRELLPLLSVKDVIRVCEPLLRLPLLGNARVTVGVYSVCVCVCESPRARLTVRFVRNLVNVLAEHRPSADDHLCAGEYAFALAAGLTRLVSMERMRAGLDPGVDVDAILRGMRRGAEPDRSTTVFESVVMCAPLAVAALVPLLESTRVATQHAVANALALILVTSLDAAAVHQAAQFASAARTPVSASDASVPAALRIVRVLESLLQFKYQHTWPVTLPVLALLYAVCGTAASSLLDALTHALIAVRNAVVAATDARELADVDREEEDYRAEAAKRRALARRKRARRAEGADAMSDDSSVDEDDDDASNARATAGDDTEVRASVIYRCIMSTLGAAVRVLGAHRFCALTPLTAADGTVIEERTWIIPLLREHAAYAPCPLAFFVGTILPAARAAEAAAASATAAGLPKNAKAHHARMIQLWSLLPVLVTAPPDCSTLFNVQFAKLLTQSISDTRYPELAAVVGRTFETIIVRARAALGMSSILTAEDGDGDDDGSEHSGDQHRAGHGEHALTVFQSGRGARRNSGAWRAADDEAASGLGQSVDDGATTVFGAGGVSVIAGADKSSDPRHPLLIESMRMRGELPTWPREQAQAALDRLREYAKNILPVLFNSFEMHVLGLKAPPPAPGAAALPLETTLSPSASQERSRKVLDAIVAYLSCTPQELLGSMLDRLLKLLSSATSLHESAAIAATAAVKGEGDVAALRASAASHAARIVSLLTLAKVLCMSLDAMPSSEVGDAHPVARVYEVLLPLLQQQQSVRVQKRAFKVLTSLLDHHRGLITSSSSRLAALMTLLADNATGSSPAARRGRLVCLRHVVRALEVLEPTHLALFPGLLVDVMLCTKDASGKVRSGAFQLLLAMCERMVEAGDGDPSELVRDIGDEKEDAVDEEPSASRPSMVEFFRMVIGGYSASTPHMRSAAVRAMSRLLYEYSDRHVVHLMLPALVHGTLQLLREKSREVAASVVGFTKVVASCSPPAMLSEFLPELIPALLTWSPESKNHIRAKVRGVMEVLVRRLSFDVVAPYVPSSDVALLTHMRKQAQRRERRRDAAAMASGSASELEAVDDTRSTTSRARTAFEAMVGLDSNDLMTDAGDDVIDEAMETRSRMTQASVARSWRVVGSAVDASSAAPSARSKASAAPQRKRGSLMTAVTADARSAFAPVAAAPLPPVGSIVDNGISRKSVTRKTVAAGSTMSARSSSSRSGSRPGALSVAATGMLRADDDTPLDLMDSVAMRSVVALDTEAAERLRRSRAAAAAADSGKGGFKVAPDGRLIITEGSDAADAGGSSGEDSDEADLRDHKAAKRAKARARKAVRFADGDDAADGGADDEAVSRHDIVGKADRAGSAEPRRRVPGAAHGRRRGDAVPLEAQGWGMKHRKLGVARDDSGRNKLSGAQFRSSAGGDRHGKGAKVQPFAYVPLDAKSMSGSGGARSVSRFHGVVASTSRSGRAALKRSDGGAPDAAAAGKRRRE